MVSVIERFPLYPSLGGGRFTHWCWVGCGLTPMSKTTPQGGIYITWYLGNIIVEERYELILVKLGGGGGRRQECIRMGARVSV